MDRTLIANATIFDGSGSAPFSGDVLVEGQRVAAVQPGGGLPRAGALRTRVHARGGRGAHVQDRRLTALDAKL